ncbi:MAG: hypothetical protein U5J62_06535 [Desulfurivibrio sp.]|nr:hypothetical protein [Desulfurivibrio sp.]
MDKQVTGLNLSLADISLDKPVQIDLFAFAQKSVPVDKVLFRLVWER